MKCYNVTFKHLSDLRSSMKKIAFELALLLALSVAQAVAVAIADAFAKTDSAHAAGYSARLKVTLAALDQITQRVAQLKAKHGGAPITATEPVFGPMARSVGLTMR